MEIFPVIIVILVLAALGAGLILGRRLVQIVSLVILTAGGAGLGYIIASLTEALSWGQEKADAILWAIASGALAAIVGGIVICVGGAIGANSRDKKEGER